MNIKGAITALATPMKMDGSLDFSSLEKLIEFQISEGINGLVAAVSYTHLTLPTKRIV